MPIPLLWIAGVAVATLITGLTAKTYYSRLSGKRLAILGARGTGKTTLYNFLTGGELTGATAVQTTKANLYKLNDLSLNIKQGVDIGGSQDFRDRWVSIMKDSDYIFYMIDISKTFSEIVGEESAANYISIVREHLNLINQFYEDNPARTDKLNIMAVSYDKVVRAFNKDKSKFSVDFEIERTKFRDSLIEDRWLIMLNPIRANKRDFLMGSLENDKAKQEMVHELLNMFKVG